MLPKTIVCFFILVALAGIPPFLDIGMQYAFVSTLIAALFATSFNLLAGQGGMLSFGHAAYFGIGAFTAIHVMRAVEMGASIPLAVLPLASGVCALAGGLMAGYFATARAGVYFSLVTLALAELLATLALRWDGLFGGEAGMSSMRMPSMGISFGSTLEVYYFVFAWVALCVALLYGYTKTPFGKLTLAIRDSEQRVRYMGYNSRLTKTIIFSISAMFSGIAGGLMAIASETVNFEVFSLHTSSQVVFATFIGGSAVFFGPAIGAITLSMFTYFMSGYTDSWMLYQGVLFVFVMLFLPDGVGGYLYSVVRERETPRRRMSGREALTVSGSSALVLMGFVFLIQSLEVVFSRQYKAAFARAGEYVDYSLFGLELSPVNPLTWLVPLSAIGAGIYFLRKRAELKGRAGNGDGDYRDERGTPATVKVRGAIDG